MVKINPDIGEQRIRIDDGVLAVSEEGKKIGKVILGSFRMHS